MAWKLKFDEETRQKRLALKLKAPDANKPTGKLESLTKPLINFN